MSAMQSEVFEAFRAMDVPEDKALRAAKALSNRDDEITDIKTEIVGMKIDIAGIKIEIAGIKTEIAGIKTEIAGMKADIAGVKAEMLVMKWMLGFVLAFQVAEFIKQFVH